MKVLIGVIVAGGFLVHSALVMKAFGDVTIPKQCEAKLYCEKEEGARCVKVRLEIKKSCSIQIPRPEGSITLEK